MSSPSPSPSPGRGKWSSRMGGALRRTSTLLSIARPPTPDRDGETKSLRRSTSGTSLGDAAAAAATVAVAGPSPIAESPAREAAAIQSEALGPSPLAQQTTSSEDAAKPDDGDPAQPAIEQTSPTGYVPPPLVDSSAGNPGAFTDDLEELPQSQVVRDPYAPVDEETNPAEAPTHEEPTTFLGKDIAESMKSYESHVQLSNDAVRGTATEQHAPAAGFSTAVMPSYEVPTHNIWAAGGSDRDMDTTMPVPDPAVHNHGSKASSIKLPNPHGGPYEDPFADPAVIPTIPGQPEAPYVPQPHISEHYQRGLSDNHGDPHAKLVMPLPAFSEVVGPQAAYHGGPKQSFPGSKSHVDSDERIPLLPTAPDRYLHTYGHNSQATTAENRVSPVVGPSTWTNSITQPRLLDLGWVEYSLPDGTTYYSHLTKRLTTDLDLRSERILHAVTLWVEDRESESIGVDLEGWLKESSTKAKKRSGWGSKKNKNEEDPVFLERYWVDHHQRSVFKEDGEDGKNAGYGRNYAYTNGHGQGKGKKHANSKPKVTEEDHLDLEYRYWAFMEAHPAHLPMSQKAKAEALDVLTWALTDQLLPSHRAIPAPFTQEECQELRTILASFNRESDHSDNGIQIRIISRILLRVAQWRQAYFRPGKPLPKDVDFGGRNPLVQRRPFTHAVFDFVISCVCLGIPYIFLERARLAGSRTADEESGLLRGPAPMLIIGACTCLMAAIVLSTSVTFLSLPGLDGITRTPAMVAILFAAFAIAASGVAILRHKADLERPVSHIGIEGIVGVSRRTIALSLPLVFLAYSIIAFIASFTLYSFRGKSVGNPLPKTPFEDYTRWIVVGVLGGLLGILTTSLLLLRR